MSDEAIGVADKMRKLRLLEERRERLLKAREAEEAKKKELKDHLTRFEIENKVMFFGKNKGYLGPYGKWELNPLQKKFVEAFPNEAYDVLTYTGSNRIGKSTIACIVIIALRLGRWPWEPIERTGWLWEARGWKYPIKVKWVGSDWENIIENVLIPKLKDLWPASVYYKTMKNQYGVEASWYDQNNNLFLEIMSNGSPVKTFESANCEVLIWDEPPDRDKRVAAARGLVDSNGVELFTMTIVNQAWVFREVLHSRDTKGRPNPRYFHLSGDIGQNIGYGITEAGVRALSAKMTPEERLVRLKGIPQFKQGLILPFDRMKHILEREDDWIPPTDWVIEAAWDYHPSTPQHVLFRGIDGCNNWIFFHEIIEHGDGKYVGQEIVRLQKLWGVKVHAVICDPLAKGDSNNRLSQYDLCAQELKRGEIGIRCASKDVAQGISALKERFFTRNGIVSCFVFRDMVTTIEQWEDWMYETKSGSGKPVKENDHMCENAYRLALTGTKHFVLNEEEADIKPVEKKRHSITGY